MHDWWPRLVIVGLLGLVIGLPLWLRPRQAMPGSGHGRGEGERLVILTPHNEQIRYEFEVGFNRWRAAQGAAPVEFDWRFSGGTSDLRKQVLAEFTAKAAKGREDEGIGADLFFGGGEYDHDILADGIAVERGGRKHALTVAQRADLPPGMFEAAYPQPRIGGERLYHRDRLWLGSALSSFGIVFNRDNLHALGLPEPATWADLAAPGYRGQLALCDPAHSGSIAATYNIILRRLGWADGWALLRRAFANSRYFTATAHKIPVDVSAGEAAAGMCIDFYGRLQAGMVAGRRLGYVDPPGLTATTVDPIMLLRGAPHRAAATQFISYVLSREGQRLWQMRRDAPVPGRPERYELRRLPVRADLYVPEEMRYWTDQVQAFAVAKPVPAGMPDYFRTIAPIAHALAIDVHDDLVAAWGAICRTPPDHPRRQRMLALFDEMPPELTLRWPTEELARDWRQIVESDADPRRGQVEATLKAFAGGITAEWRKSPDRPLEDRLRWTLFFREKYREVVRLAQ